MKMKGTVDSSLLTQQAVKETPIIRHYLCGLVNTHASKLYGQTLKVKQMCWFKLFFIVTVFSTTELTAITP